MNKYLLKQKYVQLYWQNMLIYSDSKIIDDLWVKNLIFNDTYHICHSLKEFKGNNSKFKIAFTTERFHADYDVEHRTPEGSCQFPLTEFDKKLIELSKCSNLVFVIDSEIHKESHMKFWKQADNVFWVIPGKINFNSIKSIYWNDWFRTTAEIYIKNPSLLDRLSKNNNKKFLFDALLGRERDHRNFLYNTIKHSQYADKFLLTYNKSVQSEQDFFDNNFIWPELPLNVRKKIKNPDIGTSTQINFYGINVALSQIIPLGIYNNSIYSIVAETNHNNEYVFFTEKIAKPIIAMRLFIVFSGYKFLETLHEIGFKTFDCVIDESYDLIEDPKERYNEAFKQVEYLCRQNPEVVISKIQNILIHNKNLMLNTNWDQYAISKIQQIIDNHRI